ncbi:MAG: DUF3106 domain-containing protein [Terriglobia bacterium]
MPTEPAAPNGCIRTGSPRLLCRNLLWALLLPILFLSASAQAQNRDETGAQQEAGAEPGGPRGGSTGQQRPMPGGIFRRLRELPPMQQRRVMANNPQFRRLSPERQELIRERLRQWNALTPQQKERVREREEILEGLSPAQRQYARNIFPQWCDLTPARRQAVMVAFRHLRDLPPDQRQSFLESQHVREQFSPHEREILEGLNKLLPTSGAAAPEDPDQ